MNPEFRNLKQPFGPTINVDGISFAYFGGTAYLGIPQHKEFLDFYISGIKKFGLNNGTSRNNNIQLGIYNEAEAFGAEFFGGDNALITSSGYLAAQLTVKALSKFGEVIYAPSTHPALWQEKPPATNGSFLNCANETVQKINTSDKDDWVIISNSMNNLFPELYDFSFLKKILPHKKIILIVDDSHGIGINNNGKGAYANLPKLKTVENVVVASMAKALGVDAGIVLGSDQIIAQLKRTNEFLGASPPSAAGLYAFMQAKEIYETQRQKLQHNINLFTSKIPSHVQYAPGFPAFLIEDDEIADRLLKHQILISSFPYPKVDSKPVNRIVLSSWHNEADIEKLVSSI